MTGPEHYHEAERLLDNAERELLAATPSQVNEALEVARDAYAAAQVHATLAQAAATALANRPAPNSALPMDVNEWRTVAGSKGDAA